MKGTKDKKNFMRGGIIVLVTGPLVGWFSSKPEGRT